MSGQEIFKAGSGKGTVRYPQSFFPQENFSGIHDNIHARAVLLEYGIQVMIVSLELPSLRPFSLVDEMRAMIHEMTKIPSEHIWVCMTHNLAGPHVPDKLVFPEKHQIHMNAVREAICQACGQAQESLREARFGIGEGSCDVNGNRDILFNQGWWLGRGGDGPSDKTLTVIKIEDVHEIPIAFLYHYAVKSSVMENARMADGMGQVTSDLSGEASRYMEAKLGAPALFFMGAAGDQVPKKKANYWEADDNGDMTEVNEGEKGWQYVGELGRRLGEEGVETAKKICCTVQSSMAVKHISWYFPGQKFYKGGRPYRPTLEYDYEPDEEQELKGEVLCLGNAALIGLQPETTAIIGMKLRKMAPEWKPLLIAMVNGGKDYIADESSYDRCTFSGTHSVFARGAAECFLEKISALLKEMAGDRNVF